MKKPNPETDNNLQCSAADAAEETGITVGVSGKPAEVSGFPQNPYLHNGNSTVRRQIELLTSREIEVLQLVARGKLNKQAASELCISIKTVEKHRDHLTKKLGVRGSVGLTHYAIFAGIIECDPLMAMA